MDEDEFETWLYDLLHDQVDTVSHFCDTLLTDNKGLIVQMYNGSKFQLTIVKDES